MTGSAGSPTKAASYSASASGAAFPTGHSPSVGKDRPQDPTGAAFGAGRVSRQSPAIPAATVRLRASARARCLKCCI